MAFDVSSLLLPPDGTGELDVRWFDWLPKPGSGQTQLEAVIEMLEGFKTASETLLTAAGVEVTDAAQIAYIYWKAYNTLAIEYSRRVGSTTINNEVTKAVGTATAKPFTDAANRWQLVWNVFVPESGLAQGSGVSASVRSTFVF